MNQVSNPVSLWLIFALGLLAGWLIEWVIDWLYWRRKYRAFTASYIVASNTADPSTPVVINTNLQNAPNDALNGGVQRAS